MSVVVAMSGGVDSAVVAGLLQEQGHDVVGVHMRLHDESTTAVPGHCCGFDDALDARRVADRLGIPFYVVDMRDAFKRAVMDNFTQNYINGRTPNPCIHCNGVLKFRVLMSRAKALGASHLATGHYARVVERDGVKVLAKATYAAKDQSYFLFPMPGDTLGQTLFPLGHLTKAEVRSHAARLGMAVANKPESQEVCFLPDDDHTRFVAEQAPELHAAGDIVTEDGTVVGQHDAYHRFTVGQRRGIGVAFGTPAWVLRVEPETRRVVVTTDPNRLGASGLRATHANWFDKPRDGEAVDVRIRHRGAMLAGRLRTDGSRTFHVAFDEPVRAVAPGQAAVIYDGDVVRGGGWIDTVVPFEGAETTVPVDA